MAIGNINVWCVAFLISSRKNEARGVGEVVQSSEGNLSFKFGSLKGSEAFFRVITYRVPIYSIHGRARFPIARSFNYASTICENHEKKLSINHVCHHASIMQ